MFIVDVIRPIFTVDDLAQLPDDGKRYEILRGDLAVSPSPNRKHQRLVQAVYRWLYERERQEGGQAFVAPFDVIFDEYNVTEPDVLFVRAERLHIVTEAHVQGAPDLVVEVLSPSTRSRDLGVKAHLYARFHVSEYWAVDPDMNTLTIYRLTTDGYQVTGPFRVDEVVQSPLFPETALAIADLFRS